MWGVKSTSRGRIHQELLIWSQFHIYHLIRHRRNAEDPKFVHFINAIGDGAGLEVPLHMLQCVEENGRCHRFRLPTPCSPPSSRMFKNAQF